MVPAGKTFAIESKNKCFLEHYWLWFRRHDPRAQPRESSSVKGQETGMCYLAEFTGCLGKQKDSFSKDYNPCESQGNNSVFKNICSGWSHLNEPDQYTSSRKNPKSVITRIYSLTEKYTFVNFLITNGPNNLPWAVDFITMFGKRKLQCCLLSLKPLIAFSAPQ